MNSVLRAWFVYILDMDTTYMFYESTSLLKPKLLAEFFFLLQILLQSSFCPFPLCQEVITGLKNLYQTIFLPLSFQERCFQTRLLDLVVNLLTLSLSIIELRLDA